MEVRGPRTWRHGDLKNGDMGTSNMEILGPHIDLIHNGTGTSNMMVWGLRYEDLTHMGTSNSPDTWDTIYENGHYKQHNKTDWFVAV